MTAATGLLSALLDMAAQSATLTKLKPHRPNQLLKVFARDLGADVMLPQGLGDIVKDHIRHLYEQAPTDLCVFGFTPKALLYATALRTLLNPSPVEYFGGVNINQDEMEPDADHLLDPGKWGVGYLIVYSD